MSAHLEEELDRLFRLPLSEMVKERDLLAARLRKQGDKEAAQRVKALKRPAPVAWALNQVHFHEPELFERAEESARRVRALHAEHGLDPERLRGALAAQRSAAQAVVEAAMGHCLRAGMAQGAALQRKLTWTVQGFLSGAGSEAPGRMTMELEASGFDAITEVGTPLPRPKPASDASAAAATPEAQRSERGSAPERDVRAIALAERAVDAHAREAQELATRLERLRASEARTRREHTALLERIAEHERILAALRSEAEAKQDELARTERSIQEAEGARQRAEEALGHARAKLTALMKGER